MITILCTIHELCVSPEDSNIFTHYSPIPEHTNYSQKDNPCYNDGMMCYMLRVIGLTFCAQILSIHHVLERLLDFKEALLTADVWKFVATIFGGQYVMIFGVLSALKWFADNWDSLQKV